MYKPDWDRHGFDKVSVCEILPEDTADVAGIPRYDFYVNCDNWFLRTEMKHSKFDVALLENQFVYGAVLIGLALIHDAWEQSKNRETEPDQQDKPAEDVWERLGPEVENVTRALGPFLLPMIHNLGGLTEESPELTLSAAVG